MDQRQVWMVLALGSEREYAGNMGYDDDIDSVYRYDGFVPNHQRLKEGDLLLLRDRKKILGMARASKIVSYEGQKELRRCPACGISVIKVRKSKNPRYRCKQGHEFDEPKSGKRDCRKYEVHFEGTFHAAPGRIPVESVRKACPRYNGQLAMQMLEMERLEGEARDLLTLAARVSSARRVVAAVGDASEGEYTPDDQDERESISRQIRARRGQTAFRQALRERFGDSCVVTRCGIIDLLEAAHIQPYRGEKDNHVSNGLLLRADIHTLFDLDLLGIDAETLCVRLHPRICGTEYDALEGRVLTCQPEMLSREALKLRWQHFLSKSRKS